MYKDFSISVFFPAYNEELNIKHAIEEAEKTLCELTSHYEIIVVDDGSKDGTSGVVKEMERQNPRIRLIRHDVNQGYGAALWSGITSSKYEWVFFTDADLQFRFDELKELLKHISKYDIILGYRAPRKDHFMRLLNAYGWNVLNRIFFGLKVTDIDCAFKLMRKEIVANLPIETRGAMMSAEMLIRMQRLGISFKEVPVTHLPRKFGVATGAKPEVIIRAFKEMWRLYKSELGQSYSSYAQVGIFAFIGLINTAIDLIAYFTMTRFTAFFAAHILTAKFLSFMLGAASSFLLNRKFTFAVETKIKFMEIVRFYSTVGMGVVINVAVLYVFNSLLGFPDLIAVGIATVFTFIWGFTLSKLWVFKKRPVKEPAFEGAI